LGKRGPQPRGKVKIEWSSNFVYALGLLATDGNLSPSGRHINFTSKDLEQIDNFQQALDIRVLVGKKARGGETEKKYYALQFGDVLLYKFLISIGIGPAKSKTLGRVDIPNQYFFDFLRGVFDGDGYVYSYFDPRWKSSFLWYLGFCSASPSFLEWLRLEISERVGVKGHVTKAKNSSCRQLKYAKKEASVVINKMYERKKTIHLKRKRLKIDEILAIVGRISMGMRKN
jgi:hypothetical protein